MTKKELIKKVAEVADISEKKVAEICEATFEVIVKTVATGEEVYISGFGKFKVSERAEHEGYNPHDGDKILVPSLKVPYFKASKKFKEAVGNERA